jgi:hypothetical protein
MYNHYNLLTSAVTFWKRGRRDNILFPSRGDHIAPFAAELSVNIYSILQVLLCVRSIVM